MRTRKEEQDSREKENRDEKKRRKIIERWGHERVGPKKIRKQRATATRRKEGKKVKVNLHQNVRTRRKMDLV